MLSLIALLAAADPAVATLRYETSLASWSICIDRQMAHPLGPPAQAARPERVSFAMGRCAVFGEDFRRTLPDMAARHLAEEGVRDPSPDLVGGLVEEMFRLVSDDLRREKEAG